MPAFIIIMLNHIFKEKEQDWGLYRLFTLQYMAVMILGTHKYDGDRCVEAKSAVHHHSSVKQQKENFSQHVFWFFKFFQLHSQGVWVRIIK